MKPEKLAAELFGTLVLSLAVLISINQPDFPVPTPVIAGLTLGLLVYTIGPVSGCHINPAVTVGLFSLGEIEAGEAALYVLAQFAGAAVALGVGALLFPVPAEVIAGGTVRIGLAEMMGATVFLFGIVSAVFAIVPSSMSGAVIGGSLLLGISIAAQASNGVLNPAVALGIGSFSHPYVWGPIVGGIAGSLIARGIHWRA